MWREGKLVSSIRLPDSVWSVASLDNGDIAVACADGVTRVFTQASERTAPEAELSAFNAHVANRTLELKCALGGLQLDKLPGMEALEKPGTNDGQTRVVRQGDKAFAYSWNAAKNEWESVGEVVDGPQNTANSLGGGKQTHNGKEYDYVFQIEIEEGVTSKIAMNKDDNVYMVASGEINFATNSSAFPNSGVDFPPVFGAVFLPGEAELSLPSALWMMGAPESNFSLPL